MCIDRISRRFRGSKTVITKAYKIIAVSHILSGFSTPMEGTRLTEGGWLKATGNTKLRAESTGENYAPGFHAFRTVEDAKNFAKTFWNSFEYRYIIPVKLRQLIVEGPQDGVSVIVAKEMFIEKGTYKLSRLLHKGFIKNKGLHIYAFHPKPDTKKPKSRTR